MPSATTMRLVKSRQTESTNVSAILATQAAAFNAQMGEKAINLYFTSYSQLGFKVTLITSFFRNGTLAKPAGVVLASLELNLDNEYFVFVNGDPLPLSGR